MSTLIIVKEIRNNKYEASEYVRIKIYLSSKNKVVLIKRELYVVNNLAAKTLININIIKSKGIILNL